MYVIYRRGKRFNNKVFETYDMARCYVRKWVRKHIGGSFIYDYSNVPLNVDGFSVRKQA